MKRRQGSASRFSRRRPSVGSASSKHPRGIIGRALPRPVGRTAAKQWWLKKKWSYSHVQTGRLGFDPMRSTDFPSLCGVGEWGCHVGICQERDAGICISPLPVLSSEIRSSRLRRGDLIALVRASSSRHSSTSTRALEPHMCLHVETMNKKDSRIVSPVEGRWWRSCPSASRPGRLSESGSVQAPPSRRSMPQPSTCRTKVGKPVATAE